MHAFPKTSCAQDNGLLVSHFWKHHFLKNPEQQGTSFPHYNSVLWRCGGSCQPILSTRNLSGRWGDISNNLLDEKTTCNMENWEAGMRADLLNKEKSKVDKLDSKVNKEVSKSRFSPKTLLLIWSLLTSQKPQAALSHTRLPVKVLQPYPIYRSNMHLSYTTTRMYQRNSSPQPHQ